MLLSISKVTIDTSHKDYDRIGFRVALPAPASFHECPMVLEVPVDKGEAEAWMKLHYPSIGYTVVK
jgi:hypothetical protein